MRGIVVVGAVGGCGTTSLACALALALAAGAESDPPLLVDATVHGGGPGALWGITSSRSLDDLRPLGDAITAGHVAHVIHRHAGGVDVMAGARSAADALAWAAPAAQALAGHVADRGTWVADAGCVLSPVATALLARTTLTVRVVPRTVHALRRTAALPGDAAAGTIAVATDLPGGEHISTGALGRSLGGLPVVALGRDDRGARDVADGRAPRGRRMARAVEQVMAS